jgi:putative aldouronate transport system substrate-binding protein
MEISWAGLYPPNDNNSKVQQYLEKKFNVKFKNMKFDRSNWASQFNVKIAAGEIPDFFIYEGGLTVQTLQKQGVLAEIKIEEIQKYMPKYTKSVLELEPTIWTVGNVEGKNYGIPQTFPPGATPFLPAYNGKWLKAIGYNEPPKTIKEFEDVMYKFRNNDPDGNGKKDTYGLSARGKDQNGFYFFNSVFGAFGVNPYQWNPDKNGNLQFGMITEESRQAFKLLSKWYKDGVIDPEFVTEDEPKRRQNWVNGRYGYLDGGLWYHYLPGIGAYSADFKIKNPDSDVVVGPILSGPNGPGVGLAQGVKQQPFSMGIQVEKDEKKRIKILQILEALSTDDEVYLYASYGEKGVDWDLKNGVPAMINPDYNDAAKLGASIGGGFFYSFFKTKSPLMDKYSYSQAELDMREKWTKGHKITVNQYPPDTKTKTEHPNLGKMQSEFFLKFILGQVDLDKGFDDFVMQWKKEGGDDTTEAANIAYKAMKK